MERTLEKVGRYVCRYDLPKGVVIYVVLDHVDIDQCGTGCLVSDFRAGRERRVSVEKGYVVGVVRSMDLAQTVEIF